MMDAKEEAAFVDCHKWFIGLNVLIGPAAFLSVIPLHVLTITGLLESIDGSLFARFYLTVFFLLNLSWVLCSVAHLFEKYKASLGYDAREEEGWQ